MLELKVKIFLYENFSVRLRAEQTVALCRTLDGGVGRSP